MASVKVNDYTNKAIQGSIQGTEKSILESCFLVQAQAKSLAPVAKKDGGFLRSSIGHKTPISNEGNLDVSPKKLEGYVGATASYSIYQEFGTRLMAPQPFLRPAAGALTGGGEKDIRDILKANMKQYLKDFKGGI